MVDIVLGSNVYKFALVFNGLVIRPATAANRIVSEPISDAVRELRRKRVAPIGQRGYSSPVNDGWSACSTAVDELT